jgi:hypothetical protein
MKHLAVGVTAPPIVRNPVPRWLQALNRAGRTVKSAQPSRPKNTSIPQSWPRRLASVTLISLLFPIMLSWIGLLAWGAYSAASWLWQLF